MSQEEIVIGIKTDLVGRYIAVMEVPDGVRYESPACGSEEEAKGFARKMLEIVERTMDVKQIHWGSAKAAGE